MGTVCRRSCSERYSASCFTPRESWSGETEGGSGGRASGSKILCALEHEEQRGHRHEDLQVGRRPPRQSRRSHHASVDGRCRRRLLPGPQRRRKNSAHLRARNGWRQAKGGEQQFSGDEEDGAGELLGSGPPSHDREGGAHAMRH